MSFTMEPRVYSYEERLAHAVAYAECAYGLKKKYLAEHGLSQWQIRRWVNAAGSGDLAHDIVPRNAGGMTRHEAVEVRQLKARVARLEADLEQRDKVVEVLGKAISVMHDRGVTDDAAEPDSTPPSGPSSTS